MISSLFTLTWPETQNSRPPSDIQMMIRCFWCNDEVMMMWFTSLMSLGCLLFFSPYEILGVIFTQRVVPSSLFSWCIRTNTIERIIIRCRRETISWRQEEMRESCGQSDFFRKPTGDEKRNITCCILLFFSCFLCDDNYQWLGSSSLCLPLVPLSVITNRNMREKRGCRQTKNVKCLMGTTKVLTATHTCQSIQKRSKNWFCFVLSLSLCRLFFSISRLSVYG